MEALATLERNVLQLLQLGKSCADVATILGKHPVTIRVVIRRIVLKFGQR